MTPSGHIVALLISVLVLTSTPVWGSEITPSCDFTLTAPTGEIRSPNYPDPYPAGVTCLWYINFRNVSNVTGITFFSKHYSTQTSNSVTLFVEELLIYDRNPSSVNATPTVYPSQYSVYKTHYTQLWLKFTSADNITVTSTDSALGFQLVYSAVIEGELCQNPNLPQNTFRIGNSTHVGSYYQYHCNHGYRLIGDPVQLCVLQSGVPTWSGTTPYCDNTCTVPSLNNGNASHTKIHINSTVTFTCNPPYMLKGNNLIRCVSDSHGLPLLNGEFPRCVIPDCSETVILQGNKGAIVNPGYSTGVVKAGKSCQWQISVRAGFVVRLFFRYFDLPSDDRTSLHIADTGDGQSSLLTLFGGGASQNVTSATNKVEIVYNGPLSDSNTHAGFYIQYEMGSAGGLGQGHGTLTPLVPPVTTPRLPPTTQKLVTTYVDDGSSTVKIAVGVAVPIVILLVVTLGLYLWYRKKYPVRMIIGREFAKFSNPEYAVKTTSTLTLVREDADEFFKTASRATSNVNLVIDEQGPHYVNVAFRGDENGAITGELRPEEQQPIDSDEEDRELMKRKSYLFTHVSMSDNDSSKKDEESSSDSDSISEAGFQSGGSQSSRKTQDVVVTVEHEEDAVVDIETSTRPPQLPLPDIDSFNSHFPDKRIRKTSVDVLLERSKDRRAFTNEERPVRRFSFDASLSVRGRSLSAKTPAEVSKEAEKLSALFNRSGFSNMATKPNLIKEEDTTSLESAESSSDKPKGEQDGGHVIEGKQETENKSDILEKETSVSDRSSIDENVTPISNSVNNHEFDISGSNSHQNNISQDSFVNTDETEDGADTYVDTNETIDNVREDRPEKEISCGNEQILEIVNNKESPEETMSESVNVHRNSMYEENVLNSETEDSVNIPRSQLRKDNEDEEDKIGEVHTSLEPPLSVSEGGKVDSNLDEVDGTAEVGADHDEADGTAEVDADHDEVDGTAEVGADHDEADGTAEVDADHDEVDGTAELDADHDEVDGTAEVDVDRDEVDGTEDVMSEESDQQYNTHVPVCVTSDQVEDSDHPAQVNESNTDFQKQSLDEDNPFVNPEFTTRPKSISLNTDSISTEDSTSIASTSSHVSGSYNFGRTPPESENDDDDEDDDDEEEEEGKEEEQQEEEKEEEDREKADGDVDVVAQIKQQNAMEYADKTQPSDRKIYVSESEVKSENTPVDNLDTSSLSSLDQSALDTSVELSTTSADSPVLLKRLPVSPTSNNPPKKVVAPVFNIGDDDDDDDDSPSDVSSNDSDDEGTEKKRNSKMSANIMPGIREEGSDGEAESDSDEGQSKSYNFGHGDSDSDGEGGRRFTDDDILEELSDDSSSDVQKMSGGSGSLSPAMFVFDENKDDDVDV